MRFKNFAATAALVAAAMGITAGTVNAAPAADNNAPINYTATTSDTGTIVRTDAGSMVVENGNFEIKAPNGNIVAGMPLSIHIDDFEFPVVAEISDRTATLTPQVDMDHAVYKPINLPYEDQAPFKSDYDREQAAWKRMVDTISMGATIATLVGGLGGAAVGCVLGGIAGATVASATIVGLFGAFLPAGVIGCIGGMAAVGFLGTIAGQLLVTAPVAIAAAYNYFVTINQPSLRPAN